MGLGPVVCANCQIYAEWEHPGRGYHCPLCGKSGHLLGHLWEQKDYKIYDTNQKFVKFMQGKD